MPRILAFQGLLLEQGITATVRWSKGEDIGAACGQLREAVRRVTPPVTVAVSTLGCRLNQVESQEVRGLLESHGFRAVDGEEPAQVYVVNTCTVTSRADVSDRQLIRRITREHPGALVVVTGCYAQTDPEAVARIPGVDLVVGNQEKYRLPELLASLVERRRAVVHVGDIARARDVPVAPFARVSGRSRAFVKVQDGCQHRCAFCIVPMARGGSRSQDPKVVFEQVEALVDAGYREITLTGVDIGHYGWDLIPRTTLAALVRRVVEIRGLRWLRLSSVLPAYFTPELIDVVSGSPRVAPHLHLPLQSGSDRVLRADAPAVQCRHVPDACRAPRARHSRARPRDGSDRRPPGRGETWTSRRRSISCASCRSPTCTSSRTRTARARSRAARPGACCPW